MEHKSRYYYFDIKGVRGDYLKCVVKRINETDGEIVSVIDCNKEIKMFYRIGTIHTFQFDIVLDDYKQKEIDPELYPEYFI